MRLKMRLISLAGCAVAVALVVGCNNSPAPTPAAAAAPAAAAPAVTAPAATAAAATQSAVPKGFLPLAMSVNQLMVAVVDDAAHGIWAGGNKDKPLTDLEWVEIRMNTFQLQAAATLASMGGTGQADPGWASAPMYQEWVRKLNDQAVVARSAVDAKDQTALRAAGGTLLDTCNSCHKDFKPELPSEGIYLKRGHGY